MTPYIFYNNDFLTNDATYLNASDRGFAFGDGIFETILSHNYQLPFFNDHWERFIHSVNFLNIQLPIDYSKDQLLKIILELLKKNNHSNWHGIKITLTRGSNPNNIRSLTPITDYDHSANLIISSFECSAPCQANKTLEVSPFQVSASNPTNQIKSLNYLDKILAKQRALTNNFDDALLINTNNNLLEATTSNIFFITDDNLILTPKLSDGVLAGITRQFVIESCYEMGYQIKEESINLTDLKIFKSAFITNAIQGIHNISRINDFYFTPHDYSYELFKKFLAHLNRQS